MINEVHVEFICRDAIYESLKKWAQETPQARLMLLIDSCPHCGHVLFPCDPRSRYSELGKISKVGLHTHLFYPRHWWVDNLSYEQQFSMLRIGVMRLRTSGIETTHFAPGNWKFNRDTVKACHELGLTNFSWYEYEDNAETVRWARKTYPNMNFTSVKGRYTHDWSIHHKHNVLARV